MALRRISHETAKTIIYGGAAAIGIVLVVLVRVLIAFLLTFARFSTTSCLRLSSLDHVLLHVLLTPLTVCSPFAHPLLPFC